MMRPLELTMLELGMFGPTSPLYSMPGLTCLLGGLGLASPLLSGLAKRLLGLCVPPWQIHRVFF
jgi:hypothetical protein